MGAPFTEVTDRRQAQTLRGGLNYLLPFAHADCTVAEAARALDLPVQRVHYWVQRLEAAGILRVTAVTPRAGRPVKHYRATATRFHIPARFLPDSAAGNQVRAGVERFVTDMVDNPWTGAFDEFITFTQDPEPQVLRQVYSPEPPARQQSPSHWMDVNVRLSDDEALAMLADLRAVVGRYTGLHAGDTAVPEHELIMIQWRPRRGD